MFLGSSKKKDFTEVFDGTSCHSLHIQYDLESSSFNFNKVNFWLSARHGSEHYQAGITLHVDEKEDSTYLWQFHKPTKIKALTFYL